MLGAFTWARASSERRLLRANEAERAARRQAEMMEQSAARLAAAVTVAEVGEAIVSELESADADVVFVWRSRDDATLETFGSSAVSEETRAWFAVYPLDLGGAVSEAVRTGRLVAVESGEEYDARYPALVGKRGRLGVESLLAFPLHEATGNVVGAILAGSRQRGWADEDRRRLFLGVAEQTGVALERAELQAEAERNAAASAFLVLLGEALERATTVAARRGCSSRSSPRSGLRSARSTSWTARRAAWSRWRAAARAPPSSSTTRWREFVEGVVASGREARPGRGSVPVCAIAPPRAAARPGARARRAHDPQRSRAGLEPVLDPGLAREVAARAAVALDNALLYERERETSHALQLGLLGGGVPSFEDVVVTAAYRPGTATLEVGGDWYDAFQLESGVLALVVGDVVGHGLDAAVAMGQLRGAVSALAQTASPAVLLDRLDSFVETVPSAATATLAYVELDRATGRIRYACAGHPPPLVVSPDGRVRFLWDGRSAPLGSMLGAARGEAVDHLAPGDPGALHGRPGRAALGGDRRRARASRTGGASPHARRVARRGDLRLAARRSGPGRRRLRIDGSLHPCTEHVQSFVPRSPGRTRGASHASPDVAARARDPGGGRARRRPRRLRSCGERRRARLRQRRHRHRHRRGCSTRRACSRSPFATRAPGATATATRIAGVASRSCARSPIG